MSGFEWFVAGAGVAVLALGGGMLWLFRRAAAQLVAQMDAKVEAWLTREVRAHVAPVAVSAAPVAAPVAVIVPAGLANLPADIT